MHVEPPSHAPSSLKELGIHYLMIVLGILTALGLEAGFETLHHRRLAQHTVEQLETELRANLAEVRSALQKNQAHADELKALYDDIKAQALAQQGKVKSETLYGLLRQRLKISVMTPALRRDAWDAAVADQALIHMPRESLRRFSEAYTAQRESQMAVQASFNAVGSISRLTDVAVDAEFGRADAVEVLKALYGYRLTLQSVLSTETELAGQLGESLGEAAPVTSAPAH
ncbi:hypothetical protein [Roseateles saccharophilus]|uniref:Uncharacterized protein n=1 Tax=Roseateles saccharophilus TaxID=304 RepID=A0A4R3UNB1_ROSSA|nr:hypothetical protein [Roseateles saccharophilus]MDG0833600.1 hypothetical protein [Roseateles saccharophilus]TCU92151.1 hypothetical protein EV671_102317 [Roseateles saccharophilus]